MPQRLSALDATFLQLEDRENRMQLAGMLLFRGPAPSIDGFRNAVRDRLLDLPHFRQRIRPSAFGLGRPVWVDDEVFDLDYHLSRAALPTPGGHDEVAAHIDQLSTVPLELERPLWEVGLVEGVAGGFGVSLKVHHCMVDGLSIIDIFTALLDPDSRPSQSAPERLRLHGADPRVPHMKRVGSLLDVARMVGQAPLTPFNVGQSWPTRRTNYVTVPFKHIHDVRHSHRTTVNNIVLAVVAGAMRRYLQRHDAPVETLHAFVPVNRRPQSARGNLGNEIAMTYPALPVDEASADARVRRVIEAVDHAARSGQAGTTATLMGLLNFVPAPAAAAINRVIQLQTRMFNLTVTNVPGPPAPVRFMGAELQLILGSTPLTRRHAVTVAALSYHDTFTFMVTTDPRRVPDGAGLAEDLRVELEDLHHRATTFSTADSSGSP